MEANKSPTPDEFTILGSPLVDASSFCRGSHTVNQYVIRDNPNGSEFSVLPRRKKRGPVHMELAKDESEDLLPMMIIKIDSFFLVESESLRDSVHFLRDDARRAMIRRRLNAMYEKAFQTLKKKLDHNPGKFSITIDEWRSSKNFDFLGITLHFYNNKFELENQTIRFEELNGFFFSGEVSYEILIKVSKNYGIEN